MKGIGALTRRPIAKVVQPAVAALAGFYLNMLFCLILWVLVPILLGWHATVVMSGSMEPTIKTGDILLAEPFTATDLEPGLLKPGMVPLAVNPLEKETLFTHRVISVLPEGRYVTKGDNNGSLDPEPLPADSIRAIEKLRVPALGLPIQSLHSGNPLPVAVFVILTSAALVIALDDEKRTAEAKSSGGSGRGSSAASYATRREARIARQQELGALAKSVSRVTSIIALAAAVVLSGSTAGFTASTQPPESSWTSLASGAASNAATCNGARYTVSVSTATIICTIVSPGTASVTHDLTVKGAGTDTKWTVTADWSGVAKFKDASVTNTGYPADSNIPGPTYVLTPRNLCPGSPPPDLPSASCNYTWIGLTLPARTPRFVVYLNP